jgi:hypothetical protein
MNRLDELPAEIRRIVWAFAKTKPRPIVATYHLRPVQPKHAYSLRKRDHRWR